MDCAFPRGSWHEVEPLLHHSSSSAASWSFPIRSRHNNPPPHLHHYPQGPWLLGQVSLNFDRLVTSAEKQSRGKEATCGLNDFAVRKDYVRTRARREPIAHLTKASNQHCLVIPSRLQQVGNNGIHIQGTDNGSSTINLPDDFYSRKADATRGSNHRRRQGSKSTINAELLQSLKDSPLKP